MARPSPWTFKGFRVNAVHVQLIKFPQHRKQMAGDGFFILPAACGTDLVRIVQIFRLLGADDAHPHAVLLFFLYQLIDPCSDQGLLALHHHQIGLGRIMAVFHARRFRHDVGIVPDDSLIHFDFSQHLFQHLFRNVARTQNGGHALTEIHNGRFQADVHLAAVQDHVDPSVQILFDMLRPGWG